MAYLEVPEDEYADASDHTEVPEDQDVEASANHEVTVAVDIYDVNTQKKPEYFRKMNIDVKIIDKNDNNTQRTIYEAIDAPYFREVKIFTQLFIYHCKKHPSEPQRIPNEIKKNINFLSEESSYAQVVMIILKRTAQKRKVGKNLKTLFQGQYERL